MRYELDRESPPQIVRSKTTLLDVAELKWMGMEYMSATEDIDGVTIWELRPDIHSVVTHYDGDLTNFCSEIENGPVRSGSPQAGESWIIPANIRYFAETRKGRARYGVLRYAPDALARITGGERIALSLTPRLGIRDDFIFNVVSELDRVFQSADDTQIMYGKHLLVTICYYIFDRYCDTVAQAAIPLPISGTSALVESFIRDNLCERLRLEDLALLANLPPKQFLSYFKRSFGVTPVQYIIKKRLDLAVFLLRDPKRDITDIALVVGFSNHAHFSMTFRKHFKMTPTEYRTSCH